MDLDFVRIKGVKHYHLEVGALFGGRIKQEYFGRTEFQNTIALFHPEFIDRYHKEHKNDEPYEALWTGVPDASYMGAYDSSLTPILHFRDATLPGVHILTGPNAIVRPKLEVLLLEDTEFEAVTMPIDNGLTQRYTPELEYLSSFDTRNLREYHFKREKGETKITQVGLSEFRSKIVSQ